MRSLFPLLLCAASLAMFLPTLDAQAVRFDYVASTTSAQCVSGVQCPILALPGTRVNICGTADAATLASCLGAPATTYTTTNAGTPCPTTSQLTPQSGGACTSTSDSQGGYGFWAAAGLYSYYLRVPTTAGGGTYGPFPINIGSSTGCPSNATCDANYTTLKLADTAAGTGSLYCTRNWNDQPNETLSSHIIALGATCKIQPANLQAVTFAKTATISAGPYQIFDYSHGGTFAANTGFGMDAVYPQHFGVLGNGTTNDATAFQNALNSLAALKQNVLTVPSGTYLINPTAGVGLTVGSNTTINCVASNPSGSANPIFKAGADNMAIIKWPYTNGNGVQYDEVTGCAFDQGATFTAVDGIYFDTAAFVNIERNSFYHIATGHAGIKIGASLYVDIGLNRGNGNGRLLDATVGYSSVSFPTVYYGINVGSIHGNTCSGCNQGYRASGTFNWESNDFEGNLLTGTPAAVDWVDPSASNIPTFVTASGGYFEMSDAGGVSGGKAYRFNAGALSLTGSQVVYSSSVSSGDRCLSIENSAGPIRDLNVTGNLFRGCDVGLYIDHVPSTTGVAQALVTGNDYQDIGTTRFAIGADITLADLQSYGQGMISVPGTGNVFAGGIVPQSNSFAAAATSIDVSSCAGGECEVNAFGSISALNSLSNTVPGEHITIKFGLAVPVLNSYFHLRANQDVTPPAGSVLEFYVDNGGTVREQNANSLLIPDVFGNLVTCNAAAKGLTRPVTDSNTNTWGATIAGSGSNSVLAYCDGANWTVAAK